MSIEDILSTENAYLLAMLLEEKYFTVTTIQFPFRDQLSLDLTSWHSRNRYILDINRKSAIKTRYTLQNRIRDSHILLRLDLDNKPHRNPDGQKISGNHLHIFDKTDISGSWAFELSDPSLTEVFPDFNFEELQNSGTTHIEQFRLFCQLCNIPTIPTIEDTLF